MGLPAGQSTMWASSRTSVQRRQSATVRYMPSGSVRSLWLRSRKFLQLFAGQLLDENRAIKVPENDEDQLMVAALAQAELAREAGEVPIGAIVSIDGEIVGRGFNQPIRAADPTAHAEIVALRDAARRVGSYRLSGATLCVTIEPCLMCVGALVHARIGTLVYGAAEPKSGAVVSAVRGGELPGLNHRFEVVSGVREETCRELMQSFFRDRRAISNSTQT